jgi:L-threonylcarbamoyladenylate synthase
LADAFWPGPIALVVAKSEKIVPEVTSNLITVALRMPNHPLELGLLREFDGPIAAPSANRSNRISPTTAAHVRSELGGSVEMILDGGPCAVGIESTVLDISQTSPVILRLGGISREQIQSVIGPVAVFKGSHDASMPAASPGQQALHYSPTTPAFRFPSLDAGILARRLSGGGKSVVLAIDSCVWGTGIHMMQMPLEPGPYATRFYAALHEADEMGAESIWIEEPPDTESWQAVRDRLFRATSEMKF